MRLTVLYDDEGQGRLCCGRGFSCLVESNGSKVLFDTGNEGKALLSNMRHLDIDLQSIDALFLSHGDWDHVGGVKEFLEARGPLPFFFPGSAMRSMKAFEAKAELCPVTSPAELLPGFYTTGELGGMEQSLIIEGDGGNVVLCGCAHPGLGRMMEAARTFGKVHAIMGGFHGFEELDALEGVDVIVPCHCTIKKKEIRERFRANSKGCHVGSVFEF